MSITRDNHSSPEKNDLNSTGAKVVQPSMEKINEEGDETEYGDAAKNQRAQKQRQASDYSEMFSRQQKDSIKGFTDSVLEPPG